MSGKDKVQVSDEVVAAVRKFRGEAKGDEGEAFIVLGYSNENTLVEVASGSGGLAQAAEHFTDDDARYALLRKLHKVELAKTVKFAYIDWTPGTIRPMRKALLSTHKSQIEAIMKPYHVSLQASERSELDENVIMSKIEASSGTASHVVLGQPANTPTKLYSSSASNNSPAINKGPGLVPNSVRDNVALSIENEQELKDAIKDVRNDATDTNWVLAGYKDNGTNIRSIVLIGKGSGGVAEMADRLDENQVQYGLIRVTETFDKTERVLFGFVKLRSDNVPAMLRAQIATHAGFVSSVFLPYHAEYQIDKKSELTEETVRTKLQQMMGTKTNVRSNEEAKSLRTSSSDHHLSAAKGIATVPKSALGGAKDEIQFADADAFKQAMQDLRSDPANINWLLTSWSAKDTLSLLGVGSGGVEELLEKVEDANANFGLLRVTDKIDNSVTVKFVLIRWMPEDTSYMKKAQVNTKKGAIDAVFSPFHVDFAVASKAELSTQIVMEKVMLTSGSKSR